MLTSMLLFAGCIEEKSTTTVVNSNNNVAKETTEMIKTGTLIINSNPSGADVYINGNYKGITPMSLALDSGTYEVKILKDGYKEYTKIITLTPGKTININANLEKEPIGTYNNPAKVGDVVRVKDEFLGNIYVYDISVEDYIRGEKANNIIKNANMFNPEPESGYEYLLVKVKVKYVSGEEPKGIYPFDFKVYYNRAGYDQALVVLPDYYPKLKHVRLMPGGETEGWLAYEVPKNKEVLISFEPHTKPLCFIKIE